MSELLPILAVIAIVAYVIGRQLIGEQLRGKRVILLPAILTVIGAIDLAGIPFTPEKDGTVFLANVTDQWALTSRAARRPSDW